MQAEARAWNRGYGFEFWILNPFLVQCYYVLHESSYNGCRVLALVDTQLFYRVASFPFPPLNLQYSALIALAFAGNTYFNNKRCYFVWIFLLNIQILINWLCVHRQIPYSHWFLSITFFVEPLQTKISAQNAQNTLDRNDCLFCG